MSKLIFVDCEAFGPCPAQGGCTEVGCVLVQDNAIAGSLHIKSTQPRCALLPEQWRQLHSWLYHDMTPIGQRRVMVSDNPAFDFQWVNDGLHRFAGTNLFGHSARRIGDFYAGLMNDFHNTQEWKKLRVTPHDHNALNDAMGNAEAFLRILKGERA